MDIISFEKFFDATEFIISFLPKIYPTMRITNIVITVLKKAEKELTTKSGLILSSAAADEPAHYEVIAVGPGLMQDGILQPMTLKVGEKVFIDKYAGNAVKVDGVEYLIAHEHDVLAVIE